METTLLDWILGGLALSILISGLLMLLSGIRSIGDKS
ncbi:NAD synthetase [Neosynechococcus sphagnicola sy1]|uniref:NAD synthetase n=1 Tax=Neosynechococcus sphagnicola sy1 TaxID=1497020 RepID=A0A098TIS7_9CYAN|nr:NAD synthetase [Neosynechococcus sphagnicola sy1]